MTKIEHSGISDPMGDFESRRLARRYRAHEPVWAYMAPTPAGVLAGVPAGTREVYAIGPRPASAAAWAEGTLPAGWSPSPAGGYFPGSEPVWRFVAPWGTVTVRRAAVWFGDEVDPTPGACRDAWDRLGSILTDVFHVAPPLLASPGATGRHLWQSTIPRDRTFPVLSDGAQRWIRSTSGQGRIEDWLPAEPERVEAVHAFDMRWCYAALCWGMPDGAARWLGDGDEVDPMAPAWLEVRAHVPRDWHHVGLLPWRDDAAGRWTYPAEPGRAFTTYASGAEVDLARREGWTVSVLGGLVWEMSRRKPLDGWATKLRAARDAAGGDPLVRAAVRAILLHAVGSFWAKPSTVTRTSYNAGDVPAGAIGWRMEGAMHVWQIERPPALPELAHPEWSALIWGRARARLLRSPGGAGMLAVPARDLLACRTDAVYLRRDPGDAWRSPASGVGRFRPAGRAGPMMTPATGVELAQAVKLRGSANG